jgi:hypothetical protein
MENENGYGYGHYGYNRDGFCLLEKSIGDAESQILMQLASNHSHISNTVSAGDSRLADTVVSGNARLADTVVSGHSAILGQISGSKCDILTKLGDSEGALIDRMGTYAQDNFKNQSDIAQRQFISLTAMERDLQNRLHETRFLLSKDIADRTERVSDKADAAITDVKNQLRHFEVDVHKQFCNIETEGLKNTSKILETLAANKYDALKDEVDAIRADRYADKYGYNFALQNQELSYLKQMIGSVENNQRFGSKTVQFGTGNTAGTAQTANQG